jgi:2-oxoglutarate dehydrogenase E1 component
MSDFSALANAHPSYIESLYNNWKQNPTAIAADWEQFFTGFDYAVANGETSTPTEGGVVQGVSNEKLRKELAVATIIDGYRHRGHLLADTNPIRKRKDRQPHLDFREWGLEDSDLDQAFYAGKLIGLENATLRQIVAKLNAIYAAHIGFDYSHIDSHEQRLWLRERIENRNLSPDYGLSMDKKQRILAELNGAVGMEEFLAKKYGPMKRFGLEGGENTIPALDAIINEGVESGVEEVVIGMAHRGRLNVLANIMGKTYQNIFNEFEGGIISDQIYGSGDVKYHMGYSSQMETISGKPVHLKLLPNPSHLESIDPVIEGFARAKVDLLYENNFNRILPIMIHGDASVAGQGIVYEVIQMSRLKGYEAGGTIHFVINNQVGFTTDWTDARSSHYSSSVANVIQAPTFHVNGDDAEAVVFVCELAVAFRQQFNCDVFVDMVCYRRNGHNESDNPEVTQPALYKLIKNHKNPRELYIETLSHRDKFDRDLAIKMAKEFDDFLQDRLAEVKQKQLPYTYQEPELAWKALKKSKQVTAEDINTSPATGISEERIALVLAALRKKPENFAVVNVIDRLFKNNEKLLSDGKIDWALGELMAYGAILAEQKDVRLSGEDVKRGTFSHRHAVLFEKNTNEQYNRLQHINERQGTFRIFNSFLSEYAVLGFEYGYAMAHPDTLVIWEAQFGDFHNGAQTIIDQYIAAGESKWQRQNGLVMLLPHGYEGQGPEHSSARLERFLQLCAEDNMYVANISTPANLFHALRRQLARPFRKPLIVMSPKSLLRHPLCVSDLSELSEGTAFREVIDDAAITDANNVKRVVFSTGKVYYDLLARQMEEKREDVALVRVEQLYPFPTAQVEAILAKYAGADKVWLQEEPQNAGAWFHIATYHSDLGLRYMGRKASASPATGYLKVHNKEQAEIVEKAFAF